MTTGGTLAVIIPVLVAMLGSTTIVANVLAGRIDQLARNVDARFFGEGLLASAVDTRERMLALVAALRAMTGSVRAAGLRADNATRAVDFALAQPVFAVRQLQRHLGVTYARANGLVAQLVRAGVLTTYDERSYDRRFVAPQVLEVLLRE